MSAGTDGPGARVIDVHTHRLLPVDRGFLLESGYLRPGPAGVTMTIDGLTFTASPDLTDPARQKEVFDAAGVSKRIISDFTFIYWLNRLAGEDTLDVARRVNDALAGIAAEDPGSIACMATVSPFERAHVRELERALDELGLKGCCVPTSFGDRYLDSPAAFPLFEYLEAGDVPLFVHPPIVPLGTPPDINAFRLTESVGRVFDTTLSVARMILSGVFDRFPGLKVVVPHMGAALMAVMGRLDMACRIGFEGLPAHLSATCREMPSHYLGNLYVDTMGFWPPTVREIVEVFGADHVLFGSDYPAVPISPREHIDIVDGLDISDADKKKILYENAVRLFELT